MRSDGRSEQLLPHHQSLIDASGISAPVASARGYVSIGSKADLERRGFSKAQRIVPALLTPVYNVQGDIALYQIRPDAPRIVKGKALKYETPMGARMTIDVHPFVKGMLGDPNTPLFITEGIRKADAAVTRSLCCIALLGVWNWRGTNNQGGATALADWENIALKERSVYIVFDSDVTVKHEVYAALRRLKKFLEARGAKVRVAYLPAAKNGTKVGLDDYLAAGHSVDELLALAEDELRHSEQDGGHHRTPYETRPEGLVHLKETKDGTVPVHLTNFTAKITKDIVEDDGVEQRRLFEIEARHGERVKRFTLPTTHFGAMGWAVEQLGASAIVYPGYTTREHTRTAIQMLSGDVPRQDIYAHLGWRKEEHGWVYLHAGGAIGTDGPRNDLAVAVPDALRGYVLPGVSNNDALREAIRTSLRVLDVAPIRITAPLITSVYRGVLGRCDFSVHLTGPTGEGKTELAALAQQHYGAALDARHIPGSWGSTGNALEALAFTAKDTLFCVDDYAPTGSQYDVQRLNREADRLLRAQGNHAGRQRMRADTTLRPAKPPRCLILSTGEDVPRGQSLRARLLIIEVSPGDVDWGKLTVCQRAAADGHYAIALSGYVSWLAARYEKLRQHLPQHVLELREKAHRSRFHKRTALVIASLAAGLQQFLVFAEQAGAITADERRGLWTRGWDALAEVAEAQADHHRAADPARRVLALVAAVIASGQAHVAAPDGNCPEPPEVWGWRREREESSAGPKWRPLGVRLGWVDDDDLYLEPEASVAAAQRLARDSGEALPLGTKTLHKRLRDAGHLVSTEPNRGTLTVRRSLEGKRRNVLHLRTASLMSQEPDQSDQRPQQPAPHGQISWSGSGSDSDRSHERTDHKTRPEASPGPASDDESRPAGQIGQVSDERERNYENSEGGREIRTL